MSIQNLKKACAAAAIVVAFIRAALGCPSSAIVFWLALGTAAVARGPDRRPSGAAGRRYM